MKLVGTTSATRFELFEGHFETIFHRVIAIAPSSSSDYHWKQLSRHGRHVPQLRPI